jgi:hypothetical protein
MNNNTLFISDMDGTLLNDRAELSPFAADRLNALMAGGLHFSVATARTPMTFEGILDGLNLRLPVGLLNGVIIYDPVRKRHLRTNTIPPDTVAAILETLRFKGAAGLLYELREDGRLMTYYESLEHKPIRDFVADRVRYYGTSLRKYNFANVSPKRILYVTLLDTHEKIKPVRDALAALPGLSLTLYKDAYSPDLWYLELHNENASKRGAVSYLRETYGYRHIVGFGDNLNDLPMFEACDFRVAVANAHPEVRAAADYVCLGNQDDGVVRWLEEHAMR